MKYIILVPDGMSGLPIEELKNRTCLEVANTPNMDNLAKKGIVGLSKNVPFGMIPASDVANLSILGYDPKKYYCGRGPLEAANLGISLGKNEVAFRFNMVTVFNDTMVDYSAGHITNKESSILVDSLNKEINDSRYHFYAGTSYRNLLLVNCESLEEAKKIEKIKCFAPHDILDKNILKYLPKNSNIVELMKKTKQIFENHDINKVRIDLGQNPVNIIWVWGQGRKPNMPTFEEAYGISGGMISAVDLLKGMARIIGLKIVDVPGATGYYDTNYEGKADAAIDLLENKDMVFVHVEAPDEAGHNGDIREKIKAIENFDNIIVGKILKSLENTKDYRVLITPDHPTPIAKRTHTIDPVPFVISGKNIKADNIEYYNEKEAKKGSVFMDIGSQLMKKFLFENIN